MDGKNSRLRNLFARRCFGKYYYDCVNLRSERDWKEYRDICVQITQCKEQSELRLSRAVLRHFLRDHITWQINTPRIKSLDLSCLSAYSSLRRLYIDAGDAPGGNVSLIQAEVKEPLQLESLCFRYFNFELDGMKAMPKLKDIQIMGLDHAAPLSCLRHAPRLNRLAIGGVRRMDCSMLAGVTCRVLILGGALYGLERLSLKNTVVTESLSVVDCSSLRDIRFTNAQSAIRHLDVSNNRRLCRLLCLSKCTALQTVKALSCPKLQYRDLAALAAVNGSVDVSLWRRWDRLSGLQSLMPSNVRLHGYGSNDESNRWLAGYDLAYGASGKASGR